MADAQLSVSENKAEITIPEGATQIGITIYCDPGHVEQRVHLKGGKLDLLLTGFRGSLVKMTQPYDRETLFEYTRPESGSLQLGQPGNDLYLKLTGEGHVELGHGILTGPCTLTATFNHAIDGTVKPNKVEGNGPWKSSGTHGISLTSPDGGPVMDGLSSGSSVEVTWRQR
ncbi:hypothetical protein [Streptomyces scopuliridis]|uniref:hypothetical protein n=1 Tax=Streptomyces scopuliridis TaxID=452529 RepID=UPI00342499C6